MEKFSIAAPTLVALSLPNLSEHLINESTGTRSAKCNLVTVCPKVHTCERDTEEMPSRSGWINF